MNEHDREAYVYTSEEVVVYRNHKKKTRTEVRVFTLNYLIGNVQLKATFLCEQPDAFAFTRDFGFARPHFLNH